MFAGVFFYFWFIYIIRISMITGAPNDRMFPDTFDVSGGLVYALKTRKTFICLDIFGELANSFECDETTVPRWIQSKAVRGLVWIQTITSCRFSYFISKGVKTPQSNRLKFRLFEGME